MATTNLLEIDSDFRKAVAREFDQAASKQDLKFNPEGIAITSTRDVLIAGTRVITQDNPPLDLILSEQQPLFIMYLSLPKHLGISEGCYVARVIGRDRSVALVNQDGKAIRKGTLSLTIGEDDNVAFLPSCSVTVSTSLTVSACCQFNGSSGGVSFKVSACIAFSLVPFL